MDRHKTLIARNPRVVHRNLADGTGAVLLHLDSAAYHGVNPTGELVWDLLETPMTLDLLLERLRPRLDGAPLNLDEEITAFVIDLEHRDLLRFSV
jgi:Coenzyme PQQ synthesis protein D (PqqD)